MEYPPTMTQAAPWPAALKKLVTNLRYKPGWYFTLNDIDRGQGSRGLTLIINIHTLNSYRPEERISVNHYMIVPAANYDERSWRRWLFDQVLLVERHEACEFFTLDGDKPYAPSHGPGSDPYLIREVGTDVDRRTSFRGDVSES